MTFWPLTNSDFPTDQTFHQSHDLYTELNLHRIMNGFHGAFATGVASQQGTLTLPDTWFRPPFWDLLMLQLLRPNSSNLPCLYSTFHLEYPLVLSRFCLGCRSGPRKLFQTVSEHDYFSGRISRTRLSFRARRVNIYNFSQKVLERVFVRSIVYWRNEFLFVCGSWGMNRRAEQTNRPRTAQRFSWFVCPALRCICSESRKKH